MPSDGAILFTAFEPSGDALAAALIARLRERGCARPIFALGGPMMQDAGATLLMQTTQRAVMLAGAVAEAAEHRKRVRFIERWVRTHDVALHVPTDSPAANWAICAAVRRHRPQAKIAHLAAPQLWAWAPWRVHKLRRLTDRVLCLLPFEPDWFARHGVAATFVGHPLYDKPVPAAGDFGDGAPRLALLPGSRAAEITKNWPTMRAAYERLKLKHPQLHAVVAAANQARVNQLQSLGVGSARLAIGRTGEVLAWADVALVVSGTATLQCARHHVPMTSLFNVSRLAWHGLGRWLVRTRTFTLPNLLGESMGIGRVIPELVPHFGRVKPVAAALEPLMTEGAARQGQREAFARFDALFSSVNFADASAEAVEGMIK